MKKKGFLKVAIVAALVLLVVIASMVISHPWRYVSIKCSVNVRKDEFLQQMEKLDEHYNTSNFSQIADLVFDEAQQRGYNVYLAPAIMCIETNGGNETKAQYNYWTQVPYNYGIHTIVGSESYLGFITQDTSVKWFFDNLDSIISRFAVSSYEDLSREMVYPRAWSYPLFVPDSPTEETDAYAEKLYNTVKWIQSL